MIQIQRNYIKEILNSVKGIKSLILDEPTSKQISMTYLQSEGFEQEVFLIETIENNSTENMSYVRGVYMIRVTESNLQKIFQKLSNPTLKNYSLFFLNDITDDVIRKMA